MSRPVGIALIGMGWWGKKMLDVLGAAPADIRVVRAVEPNLEAFGSSALKRASRCPPTMQTRLPILRSRPLF